MDKKASKRQVQVAKIVQEALGSVFLTNARNLFGPVLVTVTEVEVTPDLLLARVYFSVYEADKRAGVTDIFRAHHGEIKRMVGERIRKSVRRVPELEFHLDETLDRADRIDSLLKKLMGPSGEKE